MGTFFWRSRERSIHPMSSDVKDRDGGGSVCILQRSNYPGDLNLVGSISVLTLRACDMRRVLFRLICFTNFSMLFSTGLILTSGYMHQKLNIIIYSELDQHRAYMHTYIAERKIYPISFSLSYIKKKRNNKGEKEHKYMR